jgi:hypothetical protein
VLKTIEALGLPVDENWTKQEYFSNTAKTLNYTENEFTQYLWNTFHPNQIWIIVFGIGLISAILLWIYNLTLVEKKRK